MITLVDAPDAPVTSNGYNSPIRMETVIREHKKGIVNTEAEDNILAEEFLPRVEPGIREEVKRCYVGTGHFVLGRTCLIRGKPESFMYNLWFKGLLNSNHISDRPI